MSDLPPEFTRLEIESFLPGGWGLAARPGSWDARRRRWSVEVIDSADLEWKLEVRAKDVERLGRLDALKRSVDRLYREALG